MLTRRDHLIRLGLVKRRSKKEEDEPEPSDTPEPTDTPEPLNPS